MIETYVLLGTLGVHSIEDIKKKKINVIITMFSGIISVLLHLIFQNQSIFEMLIGTLPGVGILGLSHLTKGKIGVGDGVVFMLTGFYLGIIKNIYLMCISFFLAGIWGLFMIIIGKRAKNEKMPLIPFLFIGYIIMLFCGVGI